MLLVPEPEGRTLVDGNRVSEEVNLTQGAMLTIGKSNYLRFNNPAEAELIRSTIGSNERISMPQIDFRHSQDGKLLKFMTFQSFTGTLEWQSKRFLFHF